MLSSFFKRVRFLALALALCFSSLFIAIQESDYAYADVLPIDSLAGITVEQRGISPAFCPNISAQKAILVNADGEIFFERDIDTPQHIASVTKIMTAIVALEGFSLETPIYVTENAVAIGESSAGLQLGDTLSLKTALDGLLISSGNDAAISISDTLGALMRSGVSSSGDESYSLPSFEITEEMSDTDVFVAAMNAKAQELGMTNSLFANAHGLDTGIYDVEMYSSARDVATMTAYAMKNDTFRSIVAQESVVLEVKRTDGTTVPIELKTTDMLIGNYDGACGVKTGFTDKAGNCFAGACSRDGEDLYAIVLNCMSVEQRFEDAKALYNWYFENDVSYTLANSDVVAPLTIDGSTLEVPIVAEVAHQSWLDKTIKATIEDPNASIEVFAFDGNVSQSFDYADVTGNVNVGDKLGTITFYQHNEELITVDMIAAESVAAPSILENLKIAWERLWLNLKGESTYASSVALNTTPLIYNRTPGNAV